MPGNLLTLDTMFPEQSGDTEKDVITIRNYLFMLLEQMRYTLSNLDTTNWNSSALSGFVDEIRAGVVTADAVISNTVITNVLSAGNATIAELTVDQLSTGAKVKKYLSGDTSDVNYIRIHEEIIEFITAGTDGLSTEQAASRNGEALYWTDEEHTAAGTEATNYPVTVYAYTEMTKMRLLFRSDPGGTGHYVQILELGAGTGTGDLGKGFVYKGTDGMYLDYYGGTDGKLRRIVLGDNGIALTPYELESLDFYANGFSAKYSGETFAYTWAKDGNDRITALVTEDNLTIPVTWHTGDM